MSSCPAVSDGPPPTAAARWFAQALARAYPQARCALEFADPFQLLVATVLSAQCTDRQVNRATGALFARFGGPALLAAASQQDVEALVHSCGFFRSKARNIIALAATLVAEHGARVPADMEQLIALPGVARKTANVVLSVGFGRHAGIAVDTHVGRLARRLGLSRHQDPVQVERDLMALFPAAAWGALSLRLIEHGRQVCMARAPRCGACSLARRCPSAPT